MFQTRSNNPINWPIQKETGKCGILWGPFPQVAFSLAEKILVGEIWSFRGWLGKRVLSGLCRQGEGWSSHERGGSWYVLLKPLFVECEMLRGVTHYIPWISLDVSVGCGFSRSVNMILPLGNVSCYSLGWVLGDGCFWGSSLRCFRSWPSEK